MLYILDGIEYTYIYIYVYTHGIEYIWCRMYGIEKGPPHSYQYSGPIFLVGL